MDTIFLKDPGINPSTDILKNILGKSFSAYVSLIEKVSGEELALTPEWRYYKDGNAWLCKVIFKKKTIFWLSVWDKYFKVAFYFTEKTGEGIRELGIDEIILDGFKNAGHIGKLIPLVINVYDSSQVDDAIKIIKYKKALK